MSTLSGTHYASVLQPRSDARGWVVERLPLQSSEFEPSGSACVRHAANQATHASAIPYPNDPTSLVDVLPKPECGSQGSRRPLSLLTAATAQPTSRHDQLQRPPPPI